MIFPDKTFAFKLLIALDRLLNVLTGGSYVITLSTRSYINSKTASTAIRRKRWVKIKNAIDYVFWDGHCEESFEWERKLKKQWLKDHSSL